MEKSVLIGLALIPVLQTASWGVGPLTQEETRDFPVSPPKLFERVFDVASLSSGDVASWSGRIRTPTENTVRRALDYEDYDYYRILGVRNKRLKLSFQYLGSRPTTERQCAGTHLNYGVKGRYTIRMFEISYSGWTWLGGGTQSGDWLSDTQSCKRRVDNHLAAVNPELGWGVNEVQVVGTQSIPSGTQYINEVIVALMAPTRGTGDCTPVKFLGITYQNCLDASLIRVEVQ